MAAVMTLRMLARLFGPGDRERRSAPSGHSKITDQIQ
jgi:hypothetical protein